VACCNPPFGKHSSLTRKRETDALFVVLASGANGQQNCHGVPDKRASYRFVSDDRNDIAVGMSESDSTSRVFRASSS
jgi:hypothetical protein